MTEHEKVNILLVDDQPAKLLSYEVILHELGENLIKASSGQEALEHLLKTEVAVVLMDVCMPELDGFQLAAMIREHPRFQKTAMIFISAIHLTDIDRLRGYEMGAVDYVPVPVDPGGAAGQGQGFRRALSQDAAARTHERRAGAARRRRGPPSSKPRPRSCGKARSAAAWRSPPATWARGIGIATPAIACGTTASTASSASIRKHFGVTAENVARPDPSGGLAAAAERPGASAEGPKAASRTNSA